MSELMQPMPSLKTLNRVQEVPETGLTQDQVLAAAQKLSADTTGALTAALLGLHAERMEIKGRQKHLASRFTAAHPSVPAQPVPAMTKDVHDLEGLREIGAALANQEITW